MSQPAKYNYLINPRSTRARYLTIAVLAVYLLLSVACANGGASNAELEGFLTRPSPTGQAIVVPTSSPASAIPTPATAPETSKLAASSQSVVRTPETPSPIGVIAFTSDRDNGPDIYTIHEDGSNLKRLTSHENADVDPAWSPDGSKIAFNSDRDFNSLLFRLTQYPANIELALGSAAHGGFDIYVVDAEGSDVTRITTLNPADDLDPAWSPDGMKIAFSSDREDGPDALVESPDIFVMDRDGSNLTNLTPGEDSLGSFEPAWSPDGKRIVFTSNRDGNLEIYAMNSDGSGVSRLANNEGLDFEPAWSPDGERIAFTSFRDNNFDIYLMNPDGSDVVRLTDQPGVDLEAAWSPDSRRIAFASNRDGNMDIYLIDRDGTNLTRLTDHPDADRHPSWVNR